MPSCSPSARLRQPPYDVIAVDNLDLTWHGLMSLQLSRPDVVRSMRTYADVTELDLTADPPDVVVLDYWLGRENQASTPHIPTLKAWGAHVVLYTSQEAPVPLRDALRAGVDGLCLKNDGMPALVDAIACVGRGEMVFSGPLARAALEDEAIGARLTRREVEVLRGLAYGLTHAELARRLFVEKSTIDSHVENIRQQYAVSTGAKVNRARMLREALLDGYLDARPERGEIPPFG